MNTLNNGVIIYE